MTGAVVVLQLVRGRDEVHEQAHGWDEGREDKHTLKLRGTIGCSLSKMNKFAKNETTYLVFRLN